MDSGALLRRCLFVILIVSLGFYLVGYTPVPARQVIRVGVYDNPPKIFLNDKGNVSGFWHDLVRYIAEQENWEIEWVYGSWEESLKRLEKNEIDMLPDVGWTEERSQTFAFSPETVVVSWARLYVPRGSSIETILDLEDKTVAGLAGSLNFDGPEGLKALAASFNVQCTFIGMNSYLEVFQALANNEVDAGIANKDFGNLNEEEYGVDRTPIIVQPTSLRFAFTKDAELTPYLIETVDSYLKAMKSDPDSVYYQALDLYLGENSEKTIIEIIPTWVNVFFLGAGSLILFLLAVSVTARRQVRRQTAELRASERHNRVLLENNPDQIFLLNATGVILDYHSAIENSSSILSEEFHGKTVADMLPPDLAESVLRKVGKAIETGEIQTDEYKLTLKGQEREFEGRFSANEKGEVIVILRDITAKKQAERERQESERRYQTLARVSPVGIFHTDKNGETTYVNPTWCQITGLSSEEALGNGWLRAVHPEDRDSLATNWQDAASFQRTSLADYRFVRPDGTVVWVIGQAVPEYDANNQVVSFVGTITDITERKKMEDLKAAVIRAESADRLKSAFLATMSHELRTPLNSIIGFTGILLQKLVGPLNDEQEKQLTMVKGSAHHLLELINDVLDISKIEAGQIDVHNEMFDMRSSILKSLEKVTPMAERKGLSITSEIADEVQMIYSDRRRVEQILINLLNNAVKFTEHGGVHLKCNIEKGRLVTHIHDTGIGIKSEDLQTLFKPFQQIDTGLTRQYEGTGLGLSICKRLVDLLGGQISVESEWMKGSTFTFTLPMENSKS